MCRQCFCRSWYIEYHPEFIRITVWMRTNFKWRQHYLYREDWFELEDEEDQKLYDQAIKLAADDQCFPSKTIMVLGKQRLQFEPFPQMSRSIDTVIRNDTLVFRELHSLRLRCINFKNLCAYHQSWGGPEDSKTSKS